MSSLWLFQSFLDLIWSAWSNVSLNAVFGQFHRISKVLYLADWFRSLVRFFNQLRAHMSQSVIYDWFHLFVRQVDCPVRLNDPSVRFIHATNFWSMRAGKTRMRTSEWLSSNKNGVQDRCYLSTNRILRPTANESHFSIHGKLRTFQSKFVIHFAEMQNITVKLLHLLSE